MSARVLDRVDGFQRRHRLVGFPLAVVYKFGDDQGGYLAALITYYGFLSLFPLLLLLVTVLDFTLHSHPQLQQRLLESALSQFPVLGGTLREDVHARSGSGVGLAVGILGTLYGSLGAAQATQYAFNRAWSVPRNRRPNPLTSRLRSLLLLAVLGLGVAATTTLSGISALTDGTATAVSGWLRAAAVAAAVLVNVGLFALAFRVLTASDVPARALRVGAIVAGVGWEAVQLLGVYVLGHALRGASQTYGVFGLVLGLIAWIYLLALVTTVAVEITVVAHRRLWPRALLTPFTDHVELTGADRRAYTGYVQSERHKGFEAVDVDFHLPNDD
ncbi:MAG TPA: YhjD/YihY/BrkB family envelope integrity protein [Nocardioidaceae bacterium]